jgi:hypothetical protein
LSQEIEMTTSPFDLLRSVAAVVLCLVLAGCSPDVGSDAWCKEMDAISKADWSANDAASYTKHCVLGLKPDK